MADTAASPRLVQAVRSIAPDVVLIQDYESTRFDVLAPLLRAAGLDVVGLDTGGSARPGATWRRRRTVRAARRILTTHEAEAERVRRVLGHRDVEVWPAPVNAARFGAVDRATARRQLGIDPGARVLAFVGRLHAVKGLDVLVRAVRGLEVEVHIAGSGSDEAWLRGAAPNVKLLGRLEPAGVATLLAAANAVVLPSRQEGQPVAVLEAMAAARGVIATPVGGVGEVITDGVEGWLVAIDDDVALRAAIVDAMADPEEADRRGARGRSAVLARFAPERAAVELRRQLSVARR